MDTQADQHVRLEILHEIQKKGNLMNFFDKNVDGC
jgi:hypothetical protein